VEALGHLRQEDHDGKRVDKAGDDRPHQHIEPQQSGDHLQRAHQDGGGE
jgi:hypothetical protein